jgi:predicted lactoylglutathione lyase
MEVTKLSATSVEVTKEVIVPTDTKKVTYQREFIEKQIADITAQRDELIAAKEAELKECTDILKEMDKLGVVAEVKPKEEIVK